MCKHREEEREGDVSNGCAEGGVCLRVRGYVQCHGRNGDVFLCGWGRKRREKCCPVSFLTKRQQCVGGEEEERYSFSLRKKGGGGRVG